MAQLVKNLPAMQEIWVRSLGWEDPLEKGKATHSGYSGLENPMDFTVNGVAKSWTRLTLSAGRVNIFCESSYRSICLERHPN